MREKQARTQMERSVVHWLHVVVVVLPTLVLAPVCVLVEGVWGMRSVCYASVYVSGCDSVRWCVVVQQYL